ncbi:MAG: fumarylacetoacetate hydrolase family protein [Caulobacterales bacterium]|nr:fumarylacetoacetate hydrolase family protein [Caulobacterales bacterium]
MTLDAIGMVAGRIMAARKTNQPIAPVRADLPPKDIAAAYAVQQLNVRQLEAEGARRVGRKIGLTSKAVQQQLGVDQPDFGVLFDFMNFGGLGAEVSISGLIAPRIEAEMAFLLGRDIERKNMTRDELASQVEAIAASAEIVDSAIASWDIDIVDTVADNASSGGFVVGPWQPFTPDMDLPGRAMRLLRGEHEVSRGTGAASLGHPIEALAWLADTSIDLGSPLRAGEVVLSGALGPMVPLLPGDYFIEIEGFPTLWLRATS